MPRARDSCDLTCKPAYARPCCKVNWCAGFRHRPIPNRSNLTQALLCTSDILSVSPCLFPSSTIFNLCLGGSATLIKFLRCRADSTAYSSTTRASLLRLAYKATVSHTRNSVSTMANVTPEASFQTDEHLRRFLQSCDTCAQYPGNLVFRHDFEHDIVRYQDILSQHQRKLFYNGCETWVQILELKHPNPCKHCSPLLDDDDCVLTLLTCCVLL